MIVAALTCYFERNRCFKFFKTARVKVNIDGLRLIHRCVLNLAYIHVRYIQLQFSYYLLGDGSRFQYFNLIVNSH